MRKKIIVYTKYCLSCLYPDEHLELIKWAQRKDTKIEWRRTTYRPIWHAKASKLYGSEDYSSFVVKNGKVIDFMDFIKSCKNKITPEGEKKQNDVLGLPKTKRSNRKNSVLVENQKTLQKNEK